MAVAIGYPGADVLKNLHWLAPPPCKARKIGGFSRAFGAFGSERGAVAAAFNGSRILGRKPAVIDPSFFSL